MAAPPPTSARAQAAAALGSAAIPLVAIVGEVVHYRDRRGGRHG